MRYSYYLVLLTVLLTSCIKDEPQNMECDILEAWVEDEDLAQHFYQATDMRISDVPSSTEMLTFTIRQRKALPAMPIHFKLTPGATISPANGSAQDFSNGPVTYTVTSEDGQWHRTYTVDFHEMVLPSNKYDFEDFELSSNGKYYVWHEKSQAGADDSQEARYIWASGNEGFMIASPNAPATDYPTVPDEHGLDGYCVRLTTRSTGSWGKTSVKFILGTMLEEKYPTLVTPASFNTPMGVTRVIRTQLEPGHRVFVAEMGARHVGDIREMCRLVHPQMGLLTSVGPQHLDTFHTQERITKTKYELIEAIPEDGACFFADDDGIVTGLWEKTGKEKYLSGLHPERDDVWAENIRTSSEGSSFLLCTAQEKIPCVTDLLGELNIRNIVLCASVCLKLGMTGREIARGIRRLRPVEQRLELKRNPGGITLLDDAFNSNIRGAEQAFRTLKEFPSKRIVVTPGMVELGSQEAEMNQQFGKLMADCCDEVILVGHRRSQSIIAGLRETGFDERRVHVAANLAQAAEMLQPMAMPGDTILFENDLPDNYSEE